MKTVKVKVQFHSKFMAVEMPNPWGMGTDLVPAFKEWVEIYDKDVFPCHKASIIYIRGRPYRAYIDGQDADIEAVKEIFNILDNAKVKTERMGFTYCHLPEDAYQKLISILKGQ